MAAIADFGQAGSAARTPRSRTVRSTIAPTPGEDYCPVIVLKIGTSSLIVSDTSGQRLQLANVAQLVELVADLRRRGYRVVLVSSGAVGMGCIKLGIVKKPASLSTKQAVAAAGQSQLMRMYEDLFATVRVQVAQILITQSDFLEKEHWSNVRRTIMECLRIGCVPIINENDSTSTAEIRFGDNDNLSAMLSVQLEADALVLLTDVDCLYSSNPRTDPAAQPLRFVAEPWKLEVDTSTMGSDLGTGGMTTKILAARMATSAGIPCCMINGKQPQRFLSFLDFNAAEHMAADPSQGADVSASAHLQGTYFKPMDVIQTVGDTRRWITSLPVTGEVQVDDGAAQALAAKKSLMPAGIKKVVGTFSANEVVRILYGGKEVARAIVNYSSLDLTKLLGKRSSEFEEILGYSGSPEACHRANILLEASTNFLQDGGGKKDGYP